MRKELLVLWNTFRRLSLPKMRVLFRVNISHPLFSILTLFATLKTLKIAKRKFPHSHQYSGIGNAYRHALWTSLIMVYGCKISSPKKTLVWCKKISDLHEEIFPNPILEKEMDLHNNQIGINIFMKMLEGTHRQFFETSFILEKLDEKIKTAQKISSIQQKKKKELVYL